MLQTFWSEPLHKNYTHLLTNQSPEFNCSLVGALDVWCSEQIKPKQNIIVLKLLVEETDYLHKAEIFLDIWWAAPSPPGEMAGCDWILQQKGSFHQIKPSHGEFTSPNTHTHTLLSLPWNKPSNSISDLEHLLGLVAASQSLVLMCSGCEMSRVSEILVNALAQERGFE